LLSKPTSKKKAPRPRKHKKAEGKAAKEKAEAASKEVGEEAGAAKKTMDEHAKNAMRAEEKVGKAKKAAEDGKESCGRRKRFSIRSVEESCRRSTERSRGDGSGKMQKRKGT